MRLAATLIPRILYLESALQKVFSKESRPVSSFAPSHTSSCIFLIPPAHPVLSTLLISLSRLSLAALNPHLQRNNATVSIGMRSKLSEARYFSPCSTASSTGPLYIPIHPRLGAPCAIIRIFPRCSSL